MADSEEVSAAGKLLVEWICKFEAQKNPFFKSVFASESVDEKDAPFLGFSPRRDTLRLVLFLKEFRGGRLRVSR